MFDDEADSFFLPISDGLADPRGLGMNQQLRQGKSMPKITGLGEAEDMILKMFDAINLSVLIFSLGVISKIFKGTYLVSWVFIHVASGIMLQKLQKPWTKI